jgi:hypothetical protein
MPRRDIGRERDEEIRRDIEQGLSRVYRISNETEINYALDKISVQKTTEWRREVCFRSAFWCFCNKRYIEINSIFMNYGYVIYPYTYNETRRLDIQLSFGFLDEDIPKVLFVNASRFRDDYIKDLVNSPLNIVSHEFLHSIFYTHTELYIVLLVCINKDNLFQYAKDNRETLEKIAEIYGNEPSIGNEYLHRYIANNKDTTPLLRALFYKDKPYTPPQQFKILYTQLANLLKQLKKELVRSKE